MVYDPSTPNGQVRLLITDTDEAAPIFTDQEIDTFLALEESNVRRAAAMGLEVIARSEALTLKVVKLLDIQTDGAKLADSLLESARELRKQADDAEAYEEGGAFDVAEMVLDPFGSRERLINQALRGEL